MAIVEGKTKIIRPTETPGEVLIITKDSLSAGDLAKKETVEGIAVHKTTQTCNVFRLLESKGVPTAFIRRNDDTSFIAADCDMLPLELVTRRYAWGSFLKRAPEITSTVEKPHRFNKIRAEIYHKHAVITPPLVDAPIQMEESTAREKYLRDGKWDDNVYTDPLVDLKGDTWVLHSAKAPFDPAKGLMEIHAPLPKADVDRIISAIMLPVFQHLEEAWSKIETADGPVALVDMKIEVGRRKSDGSIVVADVIDNDSWRIWPGANPTKQLDKQCFREGHPLSEVSEKYVIVANLTEQF